MAARTTELRLLPRLPKAFTVRPAEPADGPQLDRFLGDPAKGHRRLSSGDACVLALGDGEIHATEWVRWGPARYEEDVRRLGVVFHVPPRSCWLHNGTNGSSEMVGPWGMVMGRLRTILELRGIETAFLQVDADDAYSIACHESMGFRKVGLLAAIRLLRVQCIGFRLEGGTWTRLSDSGFDLARLRV